MENAVKVLLVAASIQVAVLVISLGMIIFNTSSSKTEISMSLEGIQVSEFNKKYEIQEGVHYGSTVKTILGYAINDNQSLLEDGYKKQDTINLCVNIRSNAEDILDKFKDNREMINALNGTRSYGVRYIENISNVRKAVNSQKKYKIWFSYNDLGYIWEIHIDEP